MGDSNPTDFTLPKRALYQAELIGDVKLDLLSYLILILNYNDFLGLKLHEFGRCNWI